MPVAAVAGPAPETGSLPLAHSWVANRPVEGRAGRRPAISPASGHAFAEASLLDAEQAGQAVEAARRAFPAWRALSFHDRRRHLLRARQVLLERADALAALIAREQGKPEAEAHLVDVLPSLEVLKHLAENAEDALREEPVESQVLLLAHKSCRVVYEPYGVVLVIAPWNYPLLIPISGVAAALAAGNTVVLKPAPATTLIGLEIGDVFRQAGLPEGVVNVVATDDAVAQALVENPHLGKVAFTGSTGTGRRIMASAARNLTPVVLELGGKDAAIVCADAEIERAAAGVVWGAFMNAGQTCASVERVYVEQAVAERFVARVVEQTRRLRVGDPLEPEVDMGPLTLERQRALVEEHVADAVARGARLLVGGARPEREGFFYLPTVLTNVDHSMRIMREETFGPVLPIMVVKDAEEAVRLANDSEYGLTASVWTRDAAKARRLGERLEAGVVSTNDCVSSFGEPNAPRGGYKRSGIGRVHGIAGLREMAQLKYLSDDSSRRPAVFWYPYGGEFRRFVSTANRALHAASLPTRVANQLRLLFTGRFLRRVRLLSILENLDKLF